MNRITLTCGQSETGKPLSNTIGYIAEGLFKDQADIEMSPSQDELGSTVAR